VFENLCFIYLHVQEVDEEKESSEKDKDSEHNSDIQDGPDTSSFRAFLISFLSSSSSNNDSMEVHLEQNADMGYPTLAPVGKGSKGRTGFISRGKHSIGKIINKTVGIGGFRQTAAESKIGRETINHTESVAPVLEIKESKEIASSSTLPTMSEPSPLLSEIMQSILYASLPVLAQGRNWVLLYRFKTCLFFLHVLTSNHMSPLLSNVYTCNVAAHGGMEYLYLPYIEGACFALVSHFWYVIMFLR
jgi:hypothetical protein